MKIKIKLFFFKFLMYNVRYQNTQNAMKGISNTALCLSESSRYGVRLQAGRYEYLPEQLPEQERESVQKYRYICFL